MEKIIRGDIVVIPFPFSDLSASKKRPALVLAVLKYEDFVLCQITSKAKHDDYSILLEESNFAKGSLMQISFIRPNRLFTAHRSLILYKIGSIKNEKLKEVVDLTCDILKEK